MTKLRKRIISTSLWAAAIAGGYLGYGQFQNAQFARAEDRREEIRQGLSKADDLAAVFRDVGRVLEPSVVNINVRKKVPVAHHNFDPDMLKRMFPDGEIPPGLKVQPKGENPEEDDASPFDEPGDQVGTGSGVILDYVDGKGYILTNNHVAGGAEEMLITLADGREFKTGRLLGADPKTDLAVIEVKADRLSPAKWGDSDQLQKGDWIMAFGSPFGYIGSMTHGIVSALNRQAGILGMNGYESFIQVDAPINPGNSGGPLVNLRGEVVGINTAIASRSGGFQGIGFAIPSNQAKFIYNQLKSHGKVTRGWLGVGIRDVSKNLPLAKNFGYDDHNGVLVDQVIAGTPATGKLKPGDIIVAVNGKPVDSVQQLRNAIASMPPKTDVAMTIFRAKTKQEVKITLGEQPENVAMTKLPKESPALPDATVSAEGLGMRIQTLTADAAEKAGLDLKTGVIIMRVDRNSAASRELLRPGDVITMVGDTEVKTAEEFQAALKKEDIKKGVRLYVTSRDGSRFALLQAETK